MIACLFVVVRVKPLLLDGALLLCCGAPFAWLARVAPVVRPH